MPAKSFAQKTNVKPFNWTKALSKKVTTFSIPELLRLVEKSREWQTCVCGQQDHRIPRGSTGVPLDSQLHELGCRFATTIYRLYVNVDYGKDGDRRALEIAETYRRLALAITKGIERRAATVIKHLHARRKAKA